ncbi:MFS transporter (plasmid) [Deinococcus metallilatus]|uniref:MFS family permease n=1 Tax=Deinococcus metallilatus TaxID=1211322 RepID=A0AAJ5K1N8_9DEIO|nr:MFS transporter [Deinococcus metallilatus]MBB5295675.1 MFS family permease [Deinococcus metallilatus]QBY06869.1 MFS transporter [Deinococcus metallilatus]TLK32258.1 MFS transporter [Deinococcus metallilatus]GMA14204.1 MFS transporter [Deinococcus metallilatus]
MFTALTLPNFRRLWLGEVISLIGDRALLLALPYFLYQETGSTLATALLALAYYLPGLLFSSFAGVLADRWDRQHLLVYTHLIQGLVMMLLLLAPRPGLVWVAYVVTFVELTVSTLSTPVAGALLPSLVPPEDLMKANAALSLGTTGARLVGPLIGGVLIASLGIPGVVLFDAASFVVAALSFLRLQGSAPAAPDLPIQAASLLHTWRDLGREWREGLSVIRRSPVILTLMAVLSVTSLGGTLVDPFYTPFLISVLHADARTIGLLSTLGGLGALLGSAASAWLSGRVPPRALIAFGTLLVGSLMLRMYSGSSLPLMFALVPLLGVPMVISNVALATMLQTVTPDAYRGRVYGALGTTNALVGVLATATAGLIGPQVGTVRMLVIAACITLLGGLVALVFLPARTEEPAVDAGRSPPAG